MAHGGSRAGSGRKAGKLGKAKAELAEMAKEHAQDALDTLVTIAKDKKKPPAARVSAATALLDRGYGKPHQSIDHSSEDGTMTPPKKVELVAVTAKPED